MFEEIEKYYTHKGGNRYCVDHRFYKRRKRQISLVIRSPFNVGKCTYEIALLINGRLQGDTVQGFNDEKELIKTIKELLLIKGD